MAQVFGYLGLEQPADHDDALDALIARSRSDRDDTVPAITSNPSVELSEANGNAVLAGSNVVPGALVRWSDQYGVVQTLQGNNATVRFDSGESMIFNQRAGAIKRVQFVTGTQVMRRSDSALGVIVAELPGGANPTWTVVFPGAIVNVAEMGLRPAVIQRSD